MHMPYFVYILRNPQNKLYIGQTNNLSSRVKRHVSGDAARVTKTFQNFQLVYSEEFPTQIEAMRREKQLKGWTRAKKDALISGDLNLLKKL